MSLQTSARWLTPRTSNAASAMFASYDLKRVPLRDPADHARRQAGEPRSLSKPARSCWRSTSPPTAASPRSTRRCSKLQETYADHGFTVLGFPCNQFLFQESGVSREDRAFCSTKYGVTFPMFEKLRVRAVGPASALRGAHEGARTGRARPVEVKWNFEKFLINREGEVVGRFRSQVKPDAPEVVRRSSLRSARKRREGAPGCRCEAPTGGRPCPPPWPCANV